MIVSMRRTLSLHPLWDKILIALGVLIALLPASPLNMPLTYRDSGVFLYMGWRILHGEIPYRDLWDHKPPVIFYVDALGLALANGSRWGVWLIELCSLFIAAYLGFKLVKRAFGASPAVVSLYLWLASLVFVIEGGNLTTEYALPLQFACLWLACGLDEPTRRSWRGYAIGLLCGVIFFTKQNAVGVGIAITLYLVASRLRSGQVSRLIRELLTLLAGALTVSIVVVIYFAANDALPRFWSAAFLYNFAYSSGGLLAGIKSLVLSPFPLLQTGMLQFAIVGYGIALIGWLSGTALVRDHRPLLSIGLIGLPIEFLLIGLSGRSYAHYTMTLLPILSVFAGLTFWVITDHLSRVGIRRSAIGGFTAGILVVLSLALVRGYYLVASQYARVRDDTLISIVEQSTDSSDTVLLWGADTRTNFFSQRRSPTRFSYQYPLYQPGYTTEAMIDEFLDDILQEQPRLIVDMHNPATPIFDFPIKTEALQDKIETLQATYHVKEDIGTWSVYEQVPASGLP